METIQELKEEIKLLKAEKDQIVTLLTEGLKQSRVKIHLGYGQYGYTTDGSTLYSYVNTVLNLQP